MQTMEKEYIFWLFIDRELVYVYVCVYNILYVLMFPVTLKQAEYSQKHCNWMVLHITLLH